MIISQLNTKFIISDTWILARFQDNPKQAFYGFCPNAERPGRFYLSFCYSEHQPPVDFVSDKHAKLMLLESYSSTYTVSHRKSTSYLAASD
jgi:hypothetical protein